MRPRLVVLGLLSPLALAGGVAIGAAHAATAPAVQEGDAPPAAGAGPAQGGTAVIRPPTNVDPGINKALPNSVSKIDKMPVLSPPAASGGDTVVVPK